MANLKRVPDLSYREAGSVIPSNAPPPYFLLCHSESQDEQQVILQSPAADARAGGGDGMGCCQELLIGCSISLPFQPVIPYCLGTTDTARVAAMCLCRLGDRPPALRPYSASYQNQDFLQPCRASALPGNCQSRVSVDTLLVLWPWLAGEKWAAHKYA